MTVSSSGYCHTMRFEELSFKNKGAWKESEYWPWWPPEYYSKVWKCNNSNCTSYGLEQDKDLQPCPQWNPPIDDDHGPDTQVHDVHTSGWWPCWEKTMSYIIKGTKMRTELWEEDGSSGDDLVDRFYPAWPDWNGGNGDVEDSGVYNNITHVKWTFTCYWVDTAYWHVLGKDGKRHCAKNL